RAPAGTASARAELSPVVAGPSATESSPANRSEARLPTRYWPPATVPVTPSPAQVIATIVGRRPPRRGALCRPGARCRGCGLATPAPPTSAVVLGHLLASSEHHDDTRSHGV